MFTDNKNFFPTPRKLIDKMLTGIDFKLIQTVLEPSAGKGDLVEAITDKFRYSRYSYDKKQKWDIDTIEIDQNLQHIIKGKGYRLVHDDFLTYQSMKHYDLIVMNPPFDNGDKHLLKALSMQEKGGKIVCLLNAETLKNPCNNNRIVLLDQLEQYQANIEYIPDAFIDAERKTYVEIALIKIDIPRQEQNSVILDNLRQQETYATEQTEHNSYTLIDSDFIQSIVQQYNFEVKAGLKLITEYDALQPFILSSFKEKCTDTILKLTVNSRDHSDDCLCNNYIKQVRKKYWETLFMSDKFMGKFTSNLREQYYNSVNDLVDYDFSLFNIQTIKIQLNNEMIKGIESTIIDLFDEFSHKHYWDTDTCGNIHYYNGWKTNKAWKINSKVIIPLNGFNWYRTSDIDYDYKVRNKLTDIEKVFNYLDGGLTENVDLEQSLTLAQHYGETKKIPLKYFMVTFYKKGTCHIEFTNTDLLHKFNLFGSQRKGWIPPSYGKKKYKDMTQEEKEVINDFEGEISYNKVMNNTDYYIVDTNKLLMIAQ